MLGPSYDNFSYTGKYKITDKPYEIPTQKFIPIEKCDFPVEKENLEKENLDKEQYYKNL
jgi:hypothetical protein